jgi:hypothetical protein
MQPDLGNVKKRINEGGDYLDGLIAKVPGFKGYFEKAAMYDADRVIRTFLADRILGLKKSIDAVMREMPAIGGDSNLAALDSINVILERANKKCRYADYGSGASFSKIKFTQEDSDRLLEYDWRMIGKLDDSESAIAKLKSAGKDEISGLAADARKKIEEFEKNFEDRKNVIMEVI